MRLIQSAVFKLTLWYLAIIMMLSGLFSLALYRLSWDQLVETATRQTVSISNLPLPSFLEPRRAELRDSIATQLQEGQHHLLARLFILNLLTLLCGGGAAYILARRTLRPIQDSLEAQGRFTADASHELRTPLTAMRTEIEVALRDKQLGAPAARELLSSNLEEIAKLEALSAGLLRLARFETGLDPAALEAVPVAELFEAAIDRFQSQIAGHKIQLDVKVADETITGDRASLTELVVILLDNAIKYSPPSSTIKLRSEVAAGTVRIDIVDEGIGIKAADIPHIFDRFYRADRSRTQEGYGLGLSIAKRVAKLHRGTIAVDSVPDQGTTFHVKLPVRYDTKTSFLS